MKIAVVGAGNGGCAVAADMAYRGLHVTLVKTSNAMHDDNFEFLKKHNGKMTLLDFGENGSMNPQDLEVVKKEGHIANVTRDLAVLSEMDVILIYIQTNYHEELIKKIAPYIQDGQILLINPGYFSTAYVLKYCGNKKISVVEAQSSFIDGRIMEPGFFKVGFRNVRNPLGVYPAKNLPIVKEKLEQLGFPFYYMDSVVGAALHNPNMIVHTIGSVLSIPMIDAMGNDFCMYHRAFTEHAWNVLEKLDNEKMDILETMGFERLSYVEACKFRNSLDDEKDAKEVFFSYAATALNNGLISATISSLRTLVFQIVLIFTLPALLEIDGIWLSVVLVEVLSLVVTISFSVTKRKNINMRKTLKQNLNLYSNSFEFL